MVDHQAVEIELQNARQARINAELACCDIEELAEGTTGPRRPTNTVSFLNAQDAEFEPMETMKNTSRTVSPVTIAHFGASG